MHQAAAVGSFTVAYRAHLPGVDQVCFITQSIFLIRKHKIKVCESCLGRCPGSGPWDLKKSETERRELLGGGTEDTNRTLNNILPDKGLLKFALLIANQ